MSIQPVSLERHKSKRWKRFTDFNYAKEKIVVPISATELPVVACSSPVGFILEDDQFRLVTIQGLVPKQNLLVTPEGKWSGPYLPDCYRCYPFRTAQNASDAEGANLIVIDEDSGLVVNGEEDADAKAQGYEKFFDDSDNPTETMQKIIEFLAKYDAKINLTQSICTSLQEANLIQPWSIQWQDGEEAKSLSGLYCINEKALNNLPAEKYANLRENGAIVLAYGQLFSMQHISKLIRIVELGNQQKTKENMQAEVFAGALDSGSLSFENL